MKKMAVIGLLLLAACGRQDAEGSSDTVANAAPGATNIAKAVDLVPADAMLAAKYDRSCRSCHSTPDAAAPLTGHEAAWDIRFSARGADGLLASTKSGLNAMPPMGLCNDCTDDELTQLTSFMAGRTN